MAKTNGELPVANNSYRNAVVFPPRSGSGNVERDAKELGRLIRSGRTSSQTIWSPIDTLWFVTRKQDYFARTDNSISLTAECSKASWAIIQDAMNAPYSTVSRLRLESARLSNNVLKDLCKRNGASKKLGALELYDAISTASLRQVMWFIASLACSPIGSLYSLDLHLRLQEEDFRSLSGIITHPRNRLRNISIQVGQGIQQTHGFNVVVMGLANPNNHVDSMKLTFDIFDDLHVVSIVKVIHSAYFRVRSIRIASFNPATVTSSAATKLSVALRSSCLRKWVLPTLPFVALSQTLKMSQDSDIAGSCWFSLMIVCLIPHTVPRLSGKSPLGSLPTVCFKRMTCFLAEIGTIAEADLESESSQSNSDFEPASSNSDATSDEDYESADSESEDSDDEDDDIE